MKTAKLLLSAALTIACIFLCRQIIVKSIANQQNKQDFAEIRHMKYGLFSINEWKSKLSVIIRDEINDLDLSPANEKELKKHVEVQLDKLIDKVEEKVRESHKGSVSGWVKQSVIDTVVDVKDVKAGIPEYADEIIKEMTKKKTERTLKKAVTKKVKGYFNETFEQQDRSLLEEALARVGAKDIDAARTKLADAMEKDKAEIYRFTWIFVALAVMQFALCGFGKGILPAPQYMMLLLTLVALLAAGVATPMIDLEARISEFKFVLMDHPLKFDDQVMYFQTKSILDVFWIMITHEDAQMKVVGVLMVTFSVVFPVLKIISSYIFYYDFRRARENRWIRFFVLKSAKWSMTDVVIVAIFMAYIGFNGIIKSQFAKLKEAGEDVVLLTTNGTSLQPGFYLFFCYALLALFLSGILTKKSPDSQRA